MTMNRKPRGGIQAVALQYVLCACLAIVASGCRDAKNKVTPDGDNPSPAPAPIVDAYESGQKTGRQFAIDYLAKTSTAALAFSERLAVDKSKTADKQELPGGTAKGRAWEKLKDAARHEASANVNVAAAPFLNERADDAPEWFRGYSDGLKQAIPK